MNKAVITFTTIYEKSYRINDNNISLVVAKEDSVVTVVVESTGGTT